MFHLDSGTHQNVLVSFRSFASISERFCFRFDFVDITRAPANTLTPLQQSQGLYWHSHGLYKHSNCLYKPLHALSQTLQTLSQPLKALLRSLSTLMASKSPLMTFKKYF
jgi:hypothetical protein